MTAPEVAEKCKEHVYRNHEISLKIISDCDSLFMRKFLKSLFTLLGTNLALSIEYHTQRDSRSEIVNRKVEEIIRSFANYEKENCDVYRIDFEIACNSATNSTTICTMFYVNYSVHPSIISIEGLRSKNPTAQSIMDTIDDTTKFVYDQTNRPNTRTSHELHIR